MPRNGGVSGSKLPRDETPISSTEGALLLACLARENVVVLAVSGGPDSTALLWLASRWRKRRKGGPRLVAVTIDHGLRKEARAEARAVAKLAASLGIAHVTLPWRGRKPGSGLPAAAREARYELLATAARKVGATSIVTAHTRDDQAETFLMRLSRGSGLAGLAAMSRYAPRGDVAVVRPLLDVPKSRLVATLKKAKVPFADDPTNRDTAFTRPRWRKLMPELAREGIDAHNISRLVARLARANAALDAVVIRAEQALVRSEGKRQVVDESAFLTLPEEIRLRLLLRAIDRAGHEGPAELRKVESLLEELCGAAAGKPRSLKRTLAGALIDASSGFIRIAPAPPRRSARRS